MYICFAEYRIIPEHRASYLAFSDELVQSSNGSIIIYEGTDQPSLFVELWTADTKEAADRIKKERCSERSPWRHTDSWVQGGREKVHVWTFRPVIPAPPDAVAQQ
jgi:hypothetical protein